MAQPEANWSEKLGAILQNPQAMSQILSIAQSLSSPAEPAAPPELSAFSDSAPQPGASEAPAPQPSPSEPPPSEPSPLTGLDPRLLAAAQRALAAYQSPSDRRDVLLSALKPFLKPERRPKVDKAIQIARLSRVLRSALDGWKGGSGDV